MAMDLSSLLDPIGLKWMVPVGGARGRCTPPALLRGYIQHQLARIYALLGEQEKALDQLEPLLKMPYYLSPGWLKIHPAFTPLQGNPRFERLIVGR